MSLEPFLLVEGIGMKTLLEVVSLERFVVVHNGVDPLARIDVQPNGRFGVVIPSKFSSSTILGRPIRTFIR